MQKTRKSRHWVCYKPDGGMTMEVRADQGCRCSPTDRDHAILRITGFGPVRRRDAAPDETNAHIAHANMNAIRMWRISTRGVTRVKVMRSQLEHEASRIARRGR